MAVFLWRNEGPESADSRSGTSGNGSRERPPSVPALEVDICRRGAVKSKSEIIIVILDIFGHQIRFNYGTFKEWRTRADGVGYSEYIVCKTT